MYRIQLQMFKYRRSRPEVFHEKSVIEHFAKFTEHMCRSLFFNKVKG